LSSGFSASNSGARKFSEASFTNCDPTANPYQYHAVDSSREIENKSGRVSGNPGIQVIICGARTILEKVLRQYSVMSHPRFTIIAGGFCALFIYVLAKTFMDNEKRFSDLRSALDGLLRISACRCDKAGT